MRRPQQILLLGAVAMGLIGGLFLSQGRTAEMPCTQEIQTYCSEVQPGGGRLLACLEQNQTKLSMACAHRVTELKAAFGGPLAACREDWVAFCYHPRAGTEGQMALQCLQAHQAECSPDCQKVLGGATGKQGQQPRGMMP